METAPQFLQENIITMLVFNKEYLPLIASNLNIDIFEGSVNREIATQALRFYNKYKKPIAEHLPDELEHVLKKNDEKAKHFHDALESLYSFKDQINPEYVMDNFNKFVYQQQLKIGIKEAVEAIQSGKIEEADQALDRARKKQLTVFDPGIRFGLDVNKTLRFLDRVDRFILTGIKQLDDVDAAPAPKELYTFVGLSNRGKSWFMIHLAKMALLQRKRVLYVSLEMSEDRLSQRFCQSLFSMSKRPEPALYRPFFETNEQGALSRILYKDIGERPNLRDINIKDFLRKQLGKLRKPQLFIKEFPTGQLTIRNLQAYLANLETFCNFTPDLLLLDSADNMYLDPERMRLDIGRTFKELRGIAVERHLSMVTVSQVNREGLGKRWITSKNLSEDFSKLFISDILVTYNQSVEEYLRGLARLLLDKNRNDTKESRILIGQNYTIGQFAMSSHLMKEKDLNVVDNFVGRATTDDE